MTRPEQIKRREYIGLAAFIIGLINLFAGTIGLLFLSPVGLALIGLGAACTASGIFILDSIPNVVAGGEDRWT